MKTNKIQFQARMSLNQFLAQYSTEQQCEEALENSRWPQGFKCPQCSSGAYFHYRHQGGAKIFQCRNCRVQTTLTEGTIFHSTKLPLTRWFQAMYFLSQTKNNVSILELRRLIGISMENETQTYAGYV